MKRRLWCLAYASNGTYNERVKTKDGFDIVPCKFGPRIGLVLDAPVPHLVLLDRPDDKSAYGEAARTVLKSVLEARGCTPDESNMLLLAVRQMWMSDVVDIVNLVRDTIRDTSPLR